MTERNLQDILAARGMRVQVCHRQMLDNVEVELTSFCNLNCTSCTRFCDTAPTKDLLSVEQMERFVGESINCGKKWTNLVLMGGEPALHPQLSTIVGLMREYHRYSPGTTIKFITNGHGDKVNAAVDALPDFFWVHRDVKHDDQGRRIEVVERFGNAWAAPIDRQQDVENGIIKSCKIAATCGLGFNKYGFAPCGCGAAIMRVAGFDGFIKRLDEVTRERCDELLRTLCAFCGRNLEYSVPLHKDQRVYPFWKKTLKAYAKHPPKMQPYGVRSQVV